MLINLDPQWSGIAASEIQMFPELESLEEDCSFLSDDLFQSLSTQLGIPLTLTEEEIISNHNGTKDLEDVTSGTILPTFKEVDFSSIQNDLAPEEANEIKSEIKLEPESPYTQLPASPISINHSGFNGSDWQLKVSECSVQNVDEKFTLETPPISPLESPPQSPQSSFNVSNIMQRVKLVPINRQDVKCTKYILAKGDSVKHVCIQPVETTQTRKDDEPPNAIILHTQDFTEFTHKVNSQLLYPSKPQPISTNRHVNVQNSLNIDAVCTGTETFQLPQNMKIINTMSNVCPTANAESLINASAILNNRSIACNDILVKSEPITSLIVKKSKTDYAPLIVKNEVTDLITLSGNKQECELKALKRQQRMIKNRESACLSRKKKKEYVSSLERQICELKEENKQLKSENAILKQKLTTMNETITDDKRLGNISPNINKKNVAILLSIVLMVSFNFDGLKGILSQNKNLKVISTDIPLTVPEIRHSRTLLWTVDVNDNNIEDRIEESFNKSIPVHQPVCPMYINQSESIRLDSELRRWIDGESDRDNWTASIKTKLETQSLNELTSRSSSEERAKRKLYLSPDRKIKTMHKMIDIPISNDNAVEVFSPILSEHASLFEALGRKDDTFYVVWFSGEHLLLPASRKNNTARPKMSLVLPAVPINETFSTPPNHITMMQIDCEVTNTQLLHLQQSVIPIHLRNNRSTNQSNQSHSVKDIANRSTANVTRNYKPYFMKEGNEKPLYRKDVKHVYEHRSIRDFRNKDITYIHKQKYVPNKENIKL